MSFVEIPLKSNFYNFNLTVNLDGRNYELRFNYKDREQTYILDILNENGDALDSGLPCAIDVQLNIRFLHILKGSLFFQSSNKSISYANRLNLGTDVKLIYFREDNVNPV